MPSDLLEKAREFCDKNEWQGTTLEEALVAFASEAVAEERRRIGDEKGCPCCNVEHLETRLTIVVKALERSRLFVESLESAPILDQEDRDGLKFHARNAKAEIDRAFTEIRGIDRALDREEGKDAKLGK